jgi:hypothetical protein
MNGAFRQRRSNGPRNAAQEREHPASLSPSKLNLFHHFAKKESLFIFGIDKSDERAAKVTECGLAKL